MHLYYIGKNNVYTENTSIFQINVLQDAHITKNVETYKRALSSSRACRQRSRNTPSNSTPEFTIIHRRATIGIPSRRPPNKKFPFGRQNILANLTKETIPLQRRARGRVSR